MTWRMKAYKFYNEKGKNYENNDLGENYKICLVGWEDPGSSTKRTISTKMTRNCWLEWYETREGEG